MTIGQSRQGSPGFTLIEILTVVSITALLLAEFLPALKEARERSRCGVCLSNMHQLANAFATYVAENHAYPIWGLGQAEYFCNYAWGGKTNQLAWKDYEDGIFYIKAKDRPLNRMFLAGKPSEPDPITSDRQRAELPVYHCPSDDGHWTPRPGWGQWMAAYSDVGTSFLINDHWMEQAWPKPDLYGRWVEWGANLMKRRAVKGASRFVLLEEGSAQVSIRERIELMGFHRRWAKHNMLMLDGHAATFRIVQRELDRPPYPHGPAWTVFDEYAD